MPMMVRLKDARYRADARPVNETPELAWLILTLIGGFGLIQILHALSIRVRNELVIHDLRVRASELAAANYRATMLRHGIEPMSDADPEEIIEVGETLVEATTVAPAASPEPGPRGDSSTQPEPARQAA